jgi:tetratricopeptide (TPR) repeat protein
MFGKARRQRILIHGLKVALWRMVSMRKCSLITFLSTVLFMSVSLAEEYGTNPRIINCTSADLNILANKPYRPEWAPLPIMRGNIKAVPLLHILLESKDAKVRCRSAFLLGQIASPNSLDILARHLNDPEREVRLHAGVALACMGDKRGIPACAAALENTVQWIKYYAVYGLWATNTTRGRKILLTHRNDRDPIVGPAIRGALQTPFVASPSVPRLSPGKKQILRGDVFYEGCDIMIAEADWWWHKGNYDQSIRCLETAVFLNPYYIDGYSSIAWLHWSMGRNRDAIYVLIRAVEAMPFDPQPYFELGMHYFRTKQYTLAEKPFAKAVQLRPDFHTRRMYAHCLEKVGKLQEALEQWALLVSDDPTDVVAKRNLERLERLIGK